MNGLLFTAKISGRILKTKAMISPLSTLTRLSSLFPDTRFENFITEQVAIIVSACQME